MGHDDDLSSILVRYSALAPVKDISLSSSIPFNVAHESLRGILLNRHLKEYSPSQSYQQVFWKWALGQLESLTRNDEDDDIDECIYAHYLSLRTGVPSEAPPHSFVTHYWKLPGTNGHHETITLLESRTTIEAGTTGLRTWKASLALAQYLIQHPYLVYASNVLELGSGIGFVGILVASLQLRAKTPPFDHKMPSVYLTDVNSAVLARCQDNVALSCNKSSSHPNVHLRSLDWLESLSDQRNLKSFIDEAKPGIILGADVVFDPVLVPPLVDTISLCLASEPARMAFIALTVRNEETLTYFLDQIGKVLKTEVVAYDVTGNLLLEVPDQVDTRLEVKIFRVTRERGAESPTRFE